MTNHQVLDSEIAAIFSEIQYLFQVINSNGNQPQRNIVLNELWKNILRLNFLVSILQKERDNALLKQSGPNAIHPYMQFQPNTIPVQGDSGTGQGQPRNPSIQQPLAQQWKPSLHPTATQSGYSLNELSHFQPLFQPIQQPLTQHVYPPTQPATTPTGYPLQTQQVLLSQRTYPVSQQSPTQTQPEILTTQLGNPNGQTFTPEQLAQFTGMNGMPAYVAVNGVVYDVTNNAAWSLATHFGLTAGRDLTAEFASCHAGQQWILQQLKPIGRLIE